MNHKSVSTAVIALIAAATAGQSAHAQDSTTAKPAADGLEVVTITATRRDTQLQDTPLAVSALSGAILDERGIQSVGEAVQLVPGVQLTNFQPGNNDIIIRGIGTATSTQTNADSIVNATTSTYLDQIPVTGTVQKTPDYRFVDLARVEVLRGPQGTLYGQSAMGGVVRYITNKPSTAGFAGRASTYASSTNGGGWNKGIDGWVNIPMSDTVAVRLVGYVYDNSGFIDVIGTTKKEEANDEETRGGRAALRWTPNDRLTLDLTAVYSKTDVGSIQAITATYPVDFNPFTPAVTTPVSTKRSVAQHEQPAFRKGSIFSGELNYAGDAFDTTVVLARKKSDVDTKFEAADIVGLTDVYLNNRTINDSTSDTIELRLSSNGDSNRFDWLIGGYHESTGGTASSLAVVSGNPALLNFVLSLQGRPPLAVGERAIDSGRDLDYKETSFFGEGTLHFGDNVDLTLGVRSADVKNDYRFTYAKGSVEPAGRPALVGKSQATDESVTTYRANLSYKISPDLLFFANAASGYRPGGFNFGISVPVVIPDSSYSSDSLWNYELGMRSTSLDGRLIFNASVYRIDWSDLQLPTIDLVSGTFYSAVKNVSEADVKGLELESIFKATDHLSLSLSYTNSDAKMTGAPANVGGVVVNAGTRLPGTPKHAGSLALDWRSPIGAGSAQFTANAVYRYVGDRSPSLGSADVLESYKLLDLRAGLVFDDRFNVTLFADNVTDKVVVTQFIPGNPISYNFINRPRTIGLAASVSF